MPKRSRSSKNNNNSSVNNDPTTNPSESLINTPTQETPPAGVQEPVEISGVSLIIPEEPKALESFFGPHEMKRQIADALKETGKSKKAQLRSKRAKANVKEFNALFGGKKSGKLSGPEVTQMLHYADVVRMSNKENIFEHGKLGKISEEHDAQSMREHMDSAIKEAMREKSQERRDSLEVRNAETENLTMPHPPASEDANLSKKNLPQLPGGEDVTLSKKNSICQLLGAIDPEVLSELELDDTNWEVISIDGWSHCGSDTDDQFYLISRDDGLALHSFDEDSEFNDEDESAESGDQDNVSLDKDHAKDKTNTTDTTATTSVKKDDVTSCKTPAEQPEGDSIEPPKNSSCKKNKKGSKKITNNNTPESTSSSDNNCSNNNEGKSGGAGVTSGVSTPMKKKKVVVTRKYVGKEDFGEKLSSLGFKPAAEYVKAECQQWSGCYRGCQVGVSSRVLCGVLLITLRAEADSLLTGLTVLQGLTADTGLLSYTSLSLPPAQPAAC